MHNLTCFFRKTKEGKWFPVSMSAMELITSKTNNHIVTFYPFLNLTVFNFSFKESIAKNQLYSHSKRTSFTKFQFSIITHPCHVLLFFLQTPLPYLILYKVTNYGRKEKFFCINDCWSMSRHIKRNRKGQKLQFETMGALSFTHALINTCNALISPLHKVVEIIFFEAGSIAISEAQIAFRICFCYFSL